MSQLDFVFFMSSKQPPNKKGKKPVAKSTEKPKSILNLSQYIDQRIVVKYRNLTKSARREAGVGCIKGIRLAV
jgi:hypothetical protein